MRHGSVPVLYFHLMSQALWPLPDREQDARPELLLIGSPHLANPHRDLANNVIPDVLTTTRQHEIEELVDGLAQWKPTRVAVESTAADQDGLDERFSEYCAGRLSLTASENDQIGLRLARRLGLPRIHAVDCFDTQPGTDADYDFARWAQEHGMRERLDALIATQQVEANATSKDMTSTSVSQWYRSINAPRTRQLMHRVYYDIALIGDESYTPGVNWVAGWYARNLRIFGHLLRVCEPGDRLLLLYGAGHTYWLEHSARESGQFTVVDPLAWLPA
jgi:hypothetical protein